VNHEYCHIHLPSTGVGGHCIPVYPWFVIKAMEKREKFSYTRLLRTARERICTAHLKQSSLTSNFLSSA
jgi:UDP-N-acetyl-D-mannosaminuronate dehydrogenase